MWSARALLFFYSAIAALLAAFVFLAPKRPRAASPARLPGEPPPPVSAPASFLVPVHVPVPAPASSSGPESDRRLGMPIAGLTGRDLRDSFTERRGGHRHEAIDILEPRGTPVVAVDDGVVRKIFESVPGGHTVYQFNRDATLCYYYAHLDGYARGLSEGQVLRRGDLIGYVGTSGNAPPNTPHLHFAVSRLGADKHWWEGVPIDPYPLLAGR